MIELQTCKWAAAILLAFLGTLAGFISLHIANRYHRLLNFSDAFASGIFVGAAFFHLFPDAIASLQQHYHSLTTALFTSATVATLAFLLLIFAERSCKTDESQPAVQATLLLLFTLTIHAFIAGSTLGLTPTYGLFFSLFLAIIAHKAFALFALVIYLFHQKLPTAVIRLIFLFFSLVTPLGIFFGTYLHHMMNLQLESLFRAYFNAISAGIFMYIGCLRNALQSPYLLDGHQRYARYLVTLVGIACMGLLAIWI